MLKNKIRNMFRGTDYEVSLENITLNGRKVGCYGYITNPRNDAVVYLSTERSVYAPLADKNLVRYVRNTSDYSGGYNQFVDDKGLFVKIVYMLENPNPREIPWRTKR